MLLVNRESQLFRRIRKLTGWHFKQIACWQVRTIQRREAGRCKPSVGGEYITLPIKPVGIYVELHVFHPDTTLGGWTVKYKQHTVALLQLRAAGQALFL